MKFNDIMLTVLANTETMKNKKIRDMYEEMQASMNEMEEADDSAKTSTERAYLKAFMSVMERMANELNEAKMKYRNLDKEKLKIQKCQKLAEDIRIFREGCYDLRGRLQTTRELVKKQKLKADLLEREEQSLRHALRKISHSRKSIKEDYSRLKSKMEEDNIDSQRRNLPSRADHISQLGQNQDNGERLKGNEDWIKFCKKRPKSTNHQYMRTNNNFF